MALLKSILSFFICLTFFATVCNGQTGIITTIAGSGSYGFGGDGGPATAALLHNPTSVCSDVLGNVYIADQSNHRIRKVNSDGIITTIAGNGIDTFSGDGGPATLASLSYPQGVTIGNAGDIFIADWGNGRIRRIDSSGIISTVAGTDASGIWGDGVPATSAIISGPAAVAFDQVGNMYIAEGDEYVVRKVNTSGIISTFAGQYIQYYSGDGGPATAADFYDPNSLAVDAFGNVFIADYYGWKVREVNSSGIINDVAGLEHSGVGCLCTSGPATNIAMNPQSVALDQLGNFYVSDYTNYVIWKVNSAGNASIYAGGGSLFADGVPATSASIGGLNGIAIDAFGNGYAVNANTIKKITAAPNYKSDSFSVFVENNCSGIQFQLIANNYSSGQYIKTYFGNGSSLDTLTTICGIKGMANFFEPLSFSGSYSIKHVLYDGITAVDSISYSRSVSLCQNLAVGFYYDALGTCNYNDSADLLMPLPLLVRVDSNSIPIDTISATSGLFYKAYGNSGDIYSFEIISNPTGLSLMCPSTGAINDTIFTGTKNTKYFGFNCSTSTSFDLAVHSSMIAGRHKASGTILASNAFCSPINPTLTFNFSPKYIFESSFPAPSSIVGNSVTWNLNDITAITSSPVINFTVSVPTPSITSTWLTPGDTINSMAIIGPIVGDIDTTSNMVIRNDTIKSSYDPNEMSVLPGGNILPGMQLQYSINFENTGNDTAHNIYVMDTLSDNFDPHSLRIVATSAVMNIEILSEGGRNIVKFDFPNIKLLDSSHHNQCDGMVVFNVKTKGGLPDGTLIFNHAGIFFDDNPVVMTDTVENIIGLIHGAGNVCVGSDTTLTEAVAGGIWSRSNSHAAVSSGVISGITPGADTIIYSVTNQFGTVSTTKVITVNSIPDAGTITGTSVLCETSSIALADAASGGIWNSSNSSAVISGGVVTGVSSGVDTVSYVVTNSCGTAFAMASITINPLPVTPASITGSSILCVGDSSTLNDLTTGDVWSSTSLSVASVGATGVVTALGAGTTTISYTDANSCGILAATVVVTVEALPVVPAAISGVATMCVSGVINLSDITPGDTWSSSTPGVATITSAGAVTGVGAGVTLISYTETNGCGSATTTIAITVNPLLSAGYTDTGSHIVGFTYTGTATGVDSLRWSFGDGNTSIASNPVHTYSVSGIYHVCVTAYNSCGADSACGNITVAVPTAGLGTPNVSEVLVFPNPTSEELYVTGVLQSANYSLQNVTGVILRQGILEDGSNTLSLKNFAPGIYILEMTAADGKRSIVRVVKN